MECVLADTAIADEEGVTTTVVAGLVDVTMTFDVMGVLRAGQLRTLEAQAVIITSLVLKTVVSGMTVVLGFTLEEIMLEEATELCMELELEEIMLEEATELCMELELELELELTVLLMALMLCQLPLLSVYSYCIAGLAFVIFTLLM